MVCGFVPWQILCMTVDKLLRVIADIVGPIIWTRITSYVFQPIKRTLGEVLARALIMLKLSFAPHSALR